MIMRGIVATLITTTIFSFQSVYAVSQVPTDTTFKKDNPKLIYTTRDFYIDLDPDCYSTNVCLQDFSLILTFNIGMNYSQEVKQIGFKDAELLFASKSPTDKTYINQTFKKYESVSLENGWNVKVIFYPDKPTTSAVPAVSKFEFNGVVKQTSISGTLTFYSKSGQTVVALN